MTSLGLCENFKKNKDHMCGTNIMSKNTWTEEAKTMHETGDGRLR